MKQTKADTFALVGAGLALVMLIVFVPIYFISDLYLWIDLRNGSKQIPIERVETWVDIMRVQRVSRSPNTWAKMMNRLGTIYSTAFQKNSSDGSLLLVAEWCHQKALKEAAFCEEGEKASMLNLSNAALKEIEKQLNDGAVNRKLLADYRIKSSESVIMPDGDPAQR